MVELRRAGVCWERLGLVDRAKLVLDPKAKVGVIVGSFVRDVLRHFGDKNGIEEVDESSDEDGSDKLVG